MTQPPSTAHPPAQSAQGGDGTLTPSQIAQFHRDGYLVIPGFFDPAPLLQHARSVISAFEPEGHPMTQFSTGGDEGADSQKHVGDEYFLNSGSNISYFLEEGAVGKDGKLVREKELSVNKCGHALHALDKAFAKFSFSEKVRNVAKSLDVHRDPLILQSMIICKQPSIGGAVPCHNDSTFLYTDPPSAIGFWFALEDCTKSNGCLSFLPGSHRFPSASKAGAAGKSSKASRSRPVDDPAVLKELNLGPARGVNKRFVRADPKDPKSGTTFESLIAEGEEAEETTWPSGTAEARTEECPAGTLVLIHGSVLHKSEKNLSPKSRYIYTYHMIEGAEGTTYDNKNWLQPSKELLFTRLYDPPESVKQLIES